MNDPSFPDPASGAEKIQSLLKHVMGFRDGIIEPEQVGRLRELCPSLISWRHLISDIPLDKLSFHLKVDIQRAEAIRLLSNWCRSFIGSRPEDSGDGAAEIHGFLSVLLITLITMEEGAPSPSGPRNDALDGELREVAEKRAMGRHNCEETCQALLRVPSVRSAVLDLYAPEDSSPVSLSPADIEQEDNAIGEWKSLRADSLKFHRHGSTSFILCGLPEWSARGRIKFALKCVLLPYSNVPIIASKTGVVRYRPRLALCC